jgi:hypothetical protein
VPGKPQLDRKPLLILVNRLKRHNLPASHPDVGDGWDRVQGLTVITQPQQSQSGTSPQNDAKSLHKLHKGSSQDGTDRAYLMHLDLLVACMPRFDKRTSCE